MISALCVTHSSRRGLLQRAILSFMSQTFRDKELLILTNEEGYHDEILAFFYRQEIKALMNQGPDHPEYFPPWPVRVIYHGFRTPTEAALYGMAWARGEYLTCWDDDDLSHPERLAQQQAETRIGRASVLAESLYHFHDSDELFVTDFSQPAGKPSDRCAASSVMFTRELCPRLDLGANCSWASHLVDKSARQYDLIYGRPHLFMVGHNGDSQRGETFHRRQGSEMPNTWTRARLQSNQGLVTAWLQAYHFQGGKVSVCGKDAAAYDVDELPAWPDWLAATVPPEDLRQRLPTRKLTEQLQAERHKPQ
jgi:glycosyltransferase involved in cell wall biosynthesis